MLCFVVVMQSFIMNSHEVFIHIHQGCFAGTGAIVRLPQCQWSKPDGYGKISQCITTTKHIKAKTVCIFLGIYCIYEYINKYMNMCIYITWKLGNYIIQTRFSYIYLIDMVISFCTLTGCMGNCHRRKKLQWNCFVVAWSFMKLQLSPSPSFVID